MPSSNAFLSTQHFLDLMWGETDNGMPSLDCADYLRLMQLAKYKVIPTPVEIGDSARMFRMDLVRIIKRAAKQQRIELTRN
jgi:hypothetical protein